MHNNLALRYLTEDGSPTVLFEPSELIDFNVAWKWQKEWQAKLLAEPSSKQAIWMLQHFDCYTLGRGASIENLLFDESDPSVNLYRIDRGGEVTHHLPGQLVVYLVLDLRRYKTDLNWYLRKLEIVVLEVLEGLGLQGCLMNNMTGVWCNGAKVASVGIGCRRWITQHGMALNVDCQLTGFDQIVPCGLDGCQIGRLSNWLPKLKMKEVRFLMKKSLKKHFGLLWT